MSEDETKQQQEAILQQLLQQAQQAAFQQQAQQQQQQQQEQPQEQPFKPESCGGPLMCVNCAMKYAKAYFDIGKGVWADYYFRHAVKLRNEEVISKLQQENQQLTLANSELEKNMWKSITGSNGTS